MGNTESAQTLWQQNAETLGFPNETQMWMQLYVVEIRSIGELSKTLGYGPATICRRLSLCGISKRPRGGVNSPSKVLINIAHLDQRFVRLARPEEIAKIISSSTHSVYRVLKSI